MDRQLRAYIGLAFIVLVYVGGIVGWSWAALSVDQTPSRSESSHSQVRVPSDRPIGPTGVSESGCRIVFDQFVA